MRSEPRVSRWRARAGGPFVVVAIAAALQAGAALAGPPFTALATLRGQVAAALRDEARAGTLDERAVAVRRLIDLHREIGVHPRFTASGILRGMRREVSIRLAATRRSLLRDVGGQREAAGGAANQALALVDIIQQTIHPDFWDVHGGPGKVAYFQQGRSLVVLGTEQVHDDVGNLLDQLRRAGP